MNVSEVLKTSSANEERAVMAALIGYAAGDAFGVAYEFLPQKVAVDTRHLSMRGDWPFGGVSDDTHLSLLTILATTPDDPDRSARQFIDDVRAALPRLRGLGPTTRAALGLETGSFEGFDIVGPLVIGATNGGLMRTSMLGLGFTVDRDQERRDLVAAVTRVTHPAAIAVDCAILGSALYSRALANAGESAADVVVEECRSIGAVDPAVREWVTQISSWTPPTRGVAMDPVETLAAVVWVLSQTQEVLDVYRLACEIGGDTDTVAALAGGWAAARNPDSILSVPWIEDVLWSDVPHLQEAAARLTAIRSVL